MNITRKDADALNATLSVSLTKEDYLPKTEQALKKIGKTITLKGFRTGMVPAGLVRKMHGTGVLVDELNKIVNDSVNKYIEENKLEILGRPMPIPTNIDFNIQNPTDYTLEFELGLAPQFEITALKNKAVVKAPKVAINDELLNKEMDNLRSRYGTMAFIEGDIDEKDMLEVKFVELENGTDRKSVV